jgi:dephospho-CoA kinase
MLRVGLTGGLGSGKSTVASIFRELGAEIIESDELGRQLMEPGQPVFDEIVRVFGEEVVGPDGKLNRARLAELAFRNGRLDELNAIVHPAVVDVQVKWLNEVFERDPAAVAVIVSALIFEAERDARGRGERESILADWRRRIDRVIVVTAPDDLKVQRFVDRLGLSESGRGAAEADARYRLAHQISDAVKAARADYLIENVGDKDALRTQVEDLWERLKAESKKRLQTGSLK